MNGTLSTALPALIIRKFRRHRCSTGSVKVISINQQKPDSLNPAFVYLHGSAWEQANSNLLNQWVSGDSNNTFQSQKRSFGRHPWKLPCSRVTARQPNASSSWSARSILIVASDHALIGFRCMSQSTLIHAPMIIRVIIWAFSMVSVVFSGIDVTISGSLLATPLA